MGQHELETVQQFVIYNEFARVDFIGVVDLTYVDLDNDGTKLHLKYLSVN